MACRCAGKPWSEQFFGGLTPMKCCAGHFAFGTKAWRFDHVESNGSKIAANLTSGRISRQSRAGFGKSGHFAEHLGRPHLRILFRREPVEKPRIYACLQSAEHLTHLTEQQR